MNKLTIAPTSVSVSPSCCLLGFVATPQHSRANSARERATHAEHGSLGLLIVPRVEVKVTVVDIETIAIRLLFCLLLRKTVGVGVRSPAFLCSDWLVTPRVIVVLSLETAITRLSILTRALFPGSGVRRWPLLYMRWVAS